MKNTKQEENGSITLDLTDSGGVERKLNINSYRVAGTLNNSMNLAILDRKGKYLANVVLDRYDIRLLLKKIGELI